MSRESASFLAYSQIDAPHAAASGLRIVMHLINAKRPGIGPAASQVAGVNRQPTILYFTKPSGASPIFSTLMPAG